jgi:hypothetical protein
MTPDEIVLQTRRVFSNILDWLLDFFKGNPLYGLVVITILVVVWLLLKPKLSRD